MKPLPAAILVIAVMAVVSLFVGVSNVSLHALFSSGSRVLAMEVLVISRVPRTLAIILTGISMAVAGLIMQILTCNRFVEPSTAGTMEFAGLGILIVTLFAPQTSVFGKMLAASTTGLAGTALFLRILRAIPLRSVLVVPLVGIMLGNVIHALTTFIAYRFDLLQSLHTSMTGDFSGVLRGRYELLWLSFFLTGVAYIAADRLTVAGLGKEFTTNLGLDYRHVVIFGLIIVSMVSATTVVTVGIIPFLGLVVPNTVRLFIGDNIRRAVPWVAVLGAGMLLVCDIAGRLIRFPYEIPIATMMGVVGGALFFYILWRLGSRLA